MPDSDATGPKPLIPATEGREQALAHRQRIANAFLAVFGPGTRRTEAQCLVLSHLAECAGDDANSYRFHEARDGVALVAAGIHRDGARSILRIIERQLRIAESSVSPQPSTPKPAVKRQKGPRHA